MTTSRTRTVAGRSSDKRPRSQPSTFTVSSLVSPVCLSTADQASSVVDRRRSVPSVSAASRLHSPTVRSESTLEGRRTSQADFEDNGQKGKPVTTDGANV